MCSSDLLTVPMLAADPGRFRAAQETVSSASDYTNTVTATNVWWLASSESTGEGIDPAGKLRILKQYSLPNSTGRILHLGVIGAALALCLLYARRRGRGNPDDLLELVALLFLLRCMLDPLTFSYHHAPFLIALIAFEGLRRQVPVLAAISIGALLLMNEVVVPSGEPRLINAVYLAWTVPLAGAMALSLFEPERYATLARRLGAGLSALRQTPGAQSRSKSQRAW